LLMRNLAAALVPLVTDEAMQLFLLTVALGPPIIICAAFLPWRIFAANAMDLACNTGFVLILFLAALLSQSANERLVAHILTVVFCVLCLLFLVGVLKSLHGMLLLWGKTYQFFLCHHKQGGGGFSRLLKMRLKRDQRVKRQVFLDSDNLQDLSLLFGFVANFTDTLVVLCTSSILSRPWCVGEMTTAKLHGVDTILLIFPEFQWPADDFVENYPQHVEGVLSLVKFGIHVDMVQEALRWLRTRPSIVIPEEMSLAVADAVAGKLVSRRRGLFECSPHPGIDTEKNTWEGNSFHDGAKTSVSSEVAHVIGKVLWKSKIVTLPVGRSQAEHRVQNLVDPAAMSNCRVVAIVDRGDSEAVCAALLVREMLVQFLPSSLEKVPYVLRENDDVSANVDVILVICTNGCFRSAAFVRQLLTADEIGARFIPVVAVDNFRFPVDGRFTEEMRHVAPAILDHGRQHTLEDLVRVVGIVFQEIAIGVVLQDSEDVIAVRVAAIASRLSDSNVKIAKVTSAKSRAVNFLRSKTHVHSAQPSARSISLTGSTAEKDPQLVDRDTMPKTSWTELWEDTEI